MSKSKHTSGEFRVSKETQNRIFVETRVENTVFPVARLFGNRDITVYDMSDDECEANARLFAASPKLLSACLQVRFALETFKHWKQPQQDMVNSLLKDINDALGSL